MNNLVEYKMNMQKLYVSDLFSLIAKIISELYGSRLLPFPNIVSVNIGTQDEIYSLFKTF